MHRFPHPDGPTRSVKQLASEEVEPQLSVRHHPQVTFAHCGKDHHGGDSIGGKVLEFEPVVVKHPHEAAQGRSEPVVMNLIKETR